MSMVFFRDRFLDSSQLKIGLSNRALRYGDGCFESIRISNGSPVFWKRHNERLNSSLKFLAIDFDLDQRIICNWIFELLKRNQVVNGTLRIQVFRDGGGKYTPETNQGCLLMECSSDGFSMYPQPVQEKSAFVFDRIRLPKHVFGNYKALNKSIHIAAAVEAKNVGVKEAIILNTDGNATEGISSNIFALHNGTIITPSLSDGCLAGTIRSAILDGLLGKQWTVLEGSLTMDALNQYEEIWVTNAITGISVIKRLENKFFGSIQAGKAQDILSLAALNSCSDFQENLT